MEDLIVMNSMVANELEPAFPGHPGFILKDEIEARGISQRELSKNIGFAYTQLNEILNGKRQITTELALLLEAYLGIEAEPLLNMQLRYNMNMARKNQSFMQKLTALQKIAAVF